MQAHIHELSGKRIVEANDNSPLEANALIETMVNYMYDGFDAMILHEASLPPGFLDLTSGVASEVLQKFTLYRMRLAIVGDFAKYPSQALRDFIRESNNGGSINFVGTVEEGIKRLTRDLDRPNF